MPHYSTRIAESRAFDGAKHVNFVTFVTEVVVVQDFVFVIKISTRRTNPGCIDIIFKTACRLQRWILCISSYWAGRQTP